MPTAKFTVKPIQKSVWSASEMPTAKKTVTKKSVSKTTATGSKKELPPVGSSEHKAMVLRGEIKE